MSRPAPSVHASSHAAAATGISPAASGRAAAQGRAILCVIGAAATFALSAVAVKALGGAVPVAQIVLFRNLFAIPLLLGLALACAVPGQRWRVLAVRQPWALAQRTFYGVAGMFGVFYGYAHLPLATVTALGFTMPFFLTALSIPLLGEKVGPRRLGAILVGFLGVLLILRPGLGAGEAPPMLATGLVLASALAWAMGMIMIRRMGEAGESGPAIVLWYAIGGAAVGALMALPGWVWPGPLEWGLLALAGLVSALAQLLMTAAYRSGETTLIAPFEYSAILWTMSFGLLLWDEWPEALDLAGVAILIASGLYIWHREVRLKRG